MVSAAFIPSMPASSTDCLWRSTPDRGGRHLGRSHGGWLSRQLSGMAHRAQRQLHRSSDQPRYRGRLSEVSGTQVRPGRRWRLLVTATPMAAGQKLAGAAPNKPWLDRPPSEIVFEHVFLTTQPIEEPNRPEISRDAGDVSGRRMLMFSSDYPHWDGDTPDFAGRELSPSPAPPCHHETARALYDCPSGGRRFADAMRHSQ